MRGMSSTLITAAASRIVLAAAGLLLAATTLDAQEPVGRGAERERIRVFLDCSYYCDQEHVRREVDWVDWVRDREDADVHVLITRQSTGGGGDFFTLAFLGLGTFEGLDDELTAATAGDATRDEAREALVSSISLGLARYAARTPGGRGLRVRRRGAAAGGGPGPRSGAGAQTSAEDDPWNFWVFNIGLNGFLNGESSQRFVNTSGSLSANRTTEAWKINLSTRFSERSSEFELSDGSTIESDVDNWSTSGLVVKSLGPRWSLGARASVGSNSFVNQSSYWKLEPGVEYNLFPYSESTRRALTLRYTLGLNRFNYTERTIYFEDEETRWQHMLEVALDVTQPWGQADVGISGAQYLHDTGFNNLSLFASLNIRLVRGLSFRVTGTYSRVRDQLYIPAGTLTDEEILLRQQALATDYRYFTSFGISYRFGSIFNNVVNPRFGSGGGEIIF